MQPKKIILLILALIILLAIAGALMTVRDSRPEAPYGATSTETSAMLAEPNGIIVLDQRPGDSVIVSQVYFDPEGSGGFVVIYDQNENFEETGQILGASAYLEKGEHADVVIPLNRQTREGEILFALLYSGDDGDGRFDLFTDDRPIISEIAQGQIMAQFIIDADAATGTQGML